MTIDVVIRCWHAKGYGTMGKRKVFWHEAFFEALKLELHQYMDKLDFINEHPLGKEALIMDVLIIKKEPDVLIKKNIGRIFRVHNVVEYKSEKDCLTVWDYNKVLAYALLYSSFERVHVSEMTVTFCCHRHPQKMLGYLKEKRKLKLQEAGGGITYVIGDVLPVQILEGRKLSADENLFIKGLQRGKNVDDIHKILKTFDEMHMLDMRNVYIDRLFKANKDAFREAVMMSKEFEKMCFEISVERGWVEEREREAARETARETAKRLLNYGDPINKIAAVTELPVKEIMELV